MASFAQLRSLGCWCISTVTVLPALTAHLEAAADVPELHARSSEVTLVMGELFPGTRAQVVPFESVSTLLDRL